jgi:hypothetical protein
LIILNINGEQEARKFLTYLLLNYREPIMAYRSRGDDGRARLIILMAIGNELTIVSINNEPGECGNADYYFIADLTKLSCSSGLPSRDVLLNYPVMFVLKNYGLLFEIPGTGEGFEAKGVDFENKINTPVENDLPGG